VSKLSRFAENLCDKGTSRDKIEGPCKLIREEEILKALVNEKEQSSRKDLQGSAGVVQK